MPGLHLPEQDFLFPENTVWLAGTDGDGRFLSKGNLDSIGFFARRIQKDRRESEQTEK